MSPQRIQLAHIWNMALSKDLFCYWHWLEAIWVRYGDVTWNYNKPENKSAVGNAKHGHVEMELSLDNLDVRFT